MNRICGPLERNMSANFPLVIAFLAIFLASTSLVWAVPVPLRTLKRLDLQSEPIAYRIKSAKVILADYELLRRDFPTLFEAFSNAQIDKWLVKNAALMAKTQVEKGVKAKVNK